MKNYTQPGKKSIPPSALVIFTHGFDALPAIVPNGGSEQIDELIMNWVRRKLLTVQNQRKVAA